MDQLEKLSRNLGTYNGRDSVIRFVAYFSVLVSELIRMVFGKKARGIYEAIHTLGKQFSNCRVIMRFFDDLPAICALVKYWKSDNKVNSRTADIANEK